MRAYPSAAPVTTPSNSPRTQRILGVRSSAATRWISEVPGLVKQVLTPPSTSVRTSLSAPFMSGCFLSHRFHYESRKHRRETFEMRAHHAQMIARDGFYMEFSRKRFPKCDGIVWQVGIFLRPHKCYFACVTSGPVSFQRYEITFPDTRDGLSER